MNKNRERDWQEDLSCIQENFEENHEGLKEILVPCAEKDVLERYLDNSDEPSYFFKGAVLSFFICIAFWTIVIIIST
ncbi:MAG TPA: hypothetical protein VLM43_19965 [Desulfobacterales bacterium]|jgi:hypothetical protein|nr:hypothetical protein [Desulfobacterales bacterium]